MTKALTKPITNGHQSQAELELKTLNTKRSQVTLNNVTSRARLTSSVNPIDKRDSIFKADAHEVSEDVQRIDRDAATVIAEAVNTVRSTAGGALMRNSSMTNTIKPLDTGTQSNFQDYVDALHRKKKSIVIFDHQKLNKINDKMTNQESNIFTKMTQQKFLPEGKKLYLDRVNKSDAANMHVVEMDPMKRA